LLPTLPEDLSFWFPKCDDSTGHLGIQKGKRPRGLARGQCSSLGRLVQFRAIDFAQIDIVDGKLVVQPIENEAEIDQRRAAIGIGTMAEYIAKVKQAYGVPE